MVFLPQSTECTAFDREERPLAADVVERLQQMLSMDASNS